MKDATYFVIVTTALTAILVGMIVAGHISQTSPEKTCDSRGGQVIYNGYHYSKTRVYEYECRLPDGQVIQTWNGEAP